MAYDDRRRRPLYAPPPSRSRSTLSTYGPLILTVTIATAGALAWIWADRRSSDDDDDYSRRPQDPRPDDQQSTGVVHPQDQQGLGARVGAAWARSPSPAQLYDGAKGVVTAGMSAVGSGVAAAGSTLGFSRDDSSGRQDGPSDGKSNKGKRVLREGQREDGFSDHERWSEEAVSMRKATSAGKAASVASGQKKKSVAVVVSAEHDFPPIEGDPHGIEHTSILSHLLPTFNPSTTDLYILIFAPRQSSHALSSLQKQAAALLPNSPANILPFSTPTGYTHMLRHLAPGLAYVADTPALSGAQGDGIASLRGWVGQTVVVVGDDGAGGLVDTETDIDDDKNKKKPWWETSDIVGLGKGVEVVDVARVGDDWVRRVGGA